MFWIGMSTDIDAFVEKCPICISHRNMQPREPLLPHPVPDRPWQKLGADIFSLFGKDYLLVVDYYSKFPEVCQLSGKTADSVITHLKSIFSRHGIPEEVVCDNMPFDSLNMRNFAAEWNFVVKTSSPHFAQSNGQAESAIQTVKQLLLKAEESGSDPYIALMQYRATPLTGLDYSPSQLLFGRRLRTKLPTTAASLNPAYSSYKPQLQRRQQQQKVQYDRGSHPLPPLQPGDTVRVRHNNQWVPAQVKTSHSAPRSYIVETSAGGVLRRNRRHLLKTPASSAAAPTSRAIPSAASPSSTAPNAPTSAVSPSSAAPNDAVLRTRSGRAVRPVVRFNL
jgi:hypothetical protein